MAALATGFGILFLAAERERAVAALFAVAAAAVALAARLRLIDQVRASIRAHESLFHGAILLGLLVVLAIFHEEHFALLMVTTSLLLMVAALGLTVQFGYAGIVNFAGAAFLGIGCYTAAVVTKYTALPSILTLPLGGLMAALIGSILILPVLRTRGHYAALVTIAFGILFKTFLEVNDALGGPQGILVQPIRIFGWSFNDPIKLGPIDASFYVNYFVFAVILLVFAFALVRRIEQSWIGLSMDAIRLDEIASACHGLDIARWKILAFTLGNFLAGMAGALYGHMLGFIAPNNFTFGNSLILVSIILLGGLGNPWGVVVAAFFVVILPEKLQIIQEYRFLLYASLVILILLFRPEGLLPRRLRDYGWRAGRERMSELLACRNLTCRFGGLVALDRVDFTVADGGIVGLIGPNGSGKTTLFNVVTGIYAASDGRVTFAGSDITGARPQTVYWSGIARTFQRSRLCLPLSLFDNIMVGNHKRLSHGLVFNLLRRRALADEVRRNWDEARDFVTIFNPALAARLDEPVARFPMIDRRRIEICRALISRPRLLLLDEPSAGMTHEETRELMDDILLVRERVAGLTIVVIEHEMGIIERITDRCVVLNYGRKISEGAYQEVARDPQVQEAYLGAA